MEAAVTAAEAGPRCGCGGIAAVLGTVVPIATLSVIALRLSVVPIASLGVAALGLGVVAIVPLGVVALRLSVAAGCAVAIIQGAGSVVRLPIAVSEAVVSGTVCIGGGLLRVAEAAIAVREIMLPIDSEAVAIAVCSEVTAFVLSVAEAAAAKVRGAVEASMVFRMAGEG